MITADMLDRRWPRAPHSLVDAIVAFAPTVLAKFEITTPLRLAHFLAQASVECAGRTTLEENLNMGVGGKMSRSVRIYEMIFACDLGNSFLSRPSALGIAIKALARRYVPRC